MPQGRSTDRNKKNGQHSGQNKRKMAREGDEKLVNTEQSYRWLKSGDIKGETQSTIAEAQDQAISRNYFKNKILKKETE